MMSRKWTMKYGGAAAITAIAIISVAILANSIPFIPTVASASFLVMLTDPPNVPAGTTQLNLTYSDISLHMIYPNGTTEWLPVGVSGTVNLFSLINMTQTLASITIPLGSTVDKVQFAIDDVTALVNGITYNVTALSNTFVVSVADDDHVNQTLSGVLIDFNPTLVQIQASDVNGTTVYYYVLVPSAKAFIVNDIEDDQEIVGTIVQISENNKVRLVHVEEEFSANVTITSATLSVQGNVTSLSVTLNNTGSTAFEVFGLTLHGEFNTTWSLMAHENDDDDDDSDEDSFGTIPFRLNGTSLIPILGTDIEDDDDHDELDDWEHYSLTLQPGGSATLSFTGVITLHGEDDDDDEGDDDGSAMVITPIVGNNYTLRLMGEGFQTFTVTATS